MELLFNSPSWILSALVVMIPCVSFSIFALWFFHREISAKSLKKNHDVAGVIFSNVGVLYSVILGFTVINVQNRYAKAEETLYNEAMIIADLYRGASIFPENNKDTIRVNIRNYVEFMVKEEWPISETFSMHVKSRNSIDKIWASYYAIDLVNEKTIAWYNQAINQLDALMNTRLSREFNSWQHLSSMTWSLLILGGIITIGFMFFFGLENFRIQILMVILLSSYLSFILYLIFSLDHLYHGPSSIKPIALEQVSQLFDLWDKK